MQETVVISSYHTANTSKRIEKNFLDLRNMLSNQESIKIFFDHKFLPHCKYLKTIEKNFLDLRNMHQIKKALKYFSQNKKNKLTEKKFLVPSTRKFDLN